MSSIEIIKQSRIDKLKNLRKKGINPYPSKTKRTHTCQQAIKDFDNLLKSKKEIFLVGRIMAIRQHGGSIFANIEDATAKLQIYFKQDEIGKKNFKIFQDNFDIGDFIEVKGNLFLTKREEKTLLVKGYKMLCKSLSSLPEKWHGLKDVEERFRKRYLDLLINKDIRQKFLVRSQIVKLIREFLDKNSFSEVETPILQTIPGGALARPFKTHHNTFNIDLYLRIAPELFLKRLLVAGFEKIYEIGRCFRNEGVDMAHNPDFTMLEFYWAYADYEDLMNLTEEMFGFLLDNLSVIPRFNRGIQSNTKKLTDIDSPVKPGNDKERRGNNKIIEYQGKKIDFSVPWKRMEFSDLAKTDEEFKEAIKKITNPTFILYHPAGISPLAKQSEKNPKKAARFQLVVAGGMELVNAFSELNDPIEQKKRFQEQAKEREAGNEEAFRYDQDFIEALEYGMPPAAGFGMGIDRLAALLTNSHSLREIILFPLMKPK